MGNQRGNVRHAVDRQPLCQRGLRGVVRRDEQSADPGVPRSQRHGQHAGNTPERAGETQFPDERRILRRCGQLPCGGQQTHKNGQVIDGACLFGSRRSEVHRDPADGKLGSAVFHRSPHPFAGFPHGGVRQTHDVKGGQAAGEKALGSDLISGNAGQSKGTHGSDHREDLLAENVKNT